MKKEEKKIAEITLLILKNKNWNNISLVEIKKKSNVKSFDKIIKTKQDLLKIINNFIDYKLNLKSKNIEESNNKDMIFELIMMRFDILQLYRKSIISIFNSFKSNPKGLIFLLPNLLESIFLMLNYTKISSKGIIGQIKIKGIFIIYISTFLVWFNDETKDLEKTMIALDSYLDKAGKILKYSW